MPGETYRRIGVSAFAKHHQLRRDFLIIIAVSEKQQSYFPRPRYADHAPRRTHFERNDITIIKRDGTLKCFVKNQIACGTRSGACSLATRVALPRAGRVTLPRDRRGVTLSRVVSISNGVTDLTPDAVILLI